MDKIKRFVELERKKKDLARELDCVKAELAELSEEIAEYFVDEGMQNMKTSDGATVYLTEEVFVSPDYENNPFDKDTVYEAICEALEQIGWDDAVLGRRYSSRLRGKIKQYFEERGDLPDELKGLVKVHKQYRVKARGVK